MIELDELKVVSRIWQPGADINVNHFKAFRPTSISAVLLILAVAIGPFYVFESGQPQPADFILLLLALIYIGKAVRKGMPDDGLYLRSVGFLLIWVLLVAAFWFSQYQDPLLLRPVLFFWFNGVLSLALLWGLRWGSITIPDVSTALSLSLLVSISLVLVGGSDGVRSTGGFNNPNQLAFHSLCGIFGILLCSDFGKRLGLLGAAGIAAGVVCVLAASSLAGMGALLLIGVAWLVASGVSPKRLFVALVSIASAFGVLMIGDFVLELGISDNVRTRLLRAESKVGDAFEERAYDRIVINWKYAILGAGEGALERFWPPQRHEIHSMFGTLLFSYGLPGLVAFGVLIISVARRASVPIVIGLFGVLSYGFTHNSLRTTVMWVVLALCWWVSVTVPRLTRYVRKRRSDMRGLHP